MDRNQPHQYQGYPGGFPFQPYPEYPILANQTNVVPATPEYPPGGQGHPWDQPRLPYPQHLQQVGRGHPYSELTPNPAPNYVTSSRATIPLYDHTARNRHSLEHAQYSSQGSVNLNSTGSRTSIKTRRGLDYEYHMAKDPEMFFVLGKVFSCPWSEPAGETTSEETRTRDHRFVKNWLDTWVYTNIQRFVVIKPRPEQQFSYCLPIKTYRGKGTATPKARGGHHAHSIIYSGNFQGALEGEEPFSKGQIEMIPDNEDEHLEIASRLNFAKPTPIEHNLLVKSIGQIKRADLVKLLRYYDEENNTRNFRSTITQPIPEEDTRGIRDNTPTTPTQIPRAMTTRTRRSSAHSRSQSHSNPAAQVRISSQTDNHRGYGHDREFDDYGYQRGERTHDG